MEHYKLPIIGGKDCAHKTQTLAHKDTFTVGNIKVTALHTPCHTQDSICYFFEDGNDKAVFTGDTLFIGGMKSIKKLSDKADNGLFQAADAFLKAMRRRCISR